MSNSFNTRNKQLNETLRRCKGGAHEEKTGHRTKRAIQHDDFRREMKRAHWSADQTEA